MFNCCGEALLSPLLDYVVGGNAPDCDHRPRTNSGGNEWLAISVGCPSVPLIRLRGSRRGVRQNCGRSYVVELDTKGAHCAERGVSHRRANSMSCTRQVHDVTECCSATTSSSRYRSLPPWPRESSNRKRACSGRTWVRRTLAVPVLCMVLM